MGYRESSTLKGKDIIEESDSLRSASTTSQLHPPPDTTPSPVTTPKRATTPRRPTTRGRATTPRYPEFEDQSRFEGVRKLKVDHKACPHQIRQPTEARDPHSTRATRRAHWWAPRSNAKSMMPLFPSRGSTRPRDWKSFENSWPKRPSTISKSRRTLHASRTSHLPSLLVSSPARTRRIRVRRLM